MLVLTFLCLSMLVGQARTTQEGRKDAAHSFTNEWAVQLHTDDSNLASQIAAQHGFSSAGRIGDLPGFFRFVEKRTNSRQKRSVGDRDSTARLQAHPSVKWVEQQRVLVRTKRHLMPLKRGIISREARKELGKNYYNDKLWPSQWYLLNYGQRDTPLGNDLNVMPVWQRGLHGQGVVVTVLDDGLDHTHPELKDNYDPAASYDLNDDDPDPFPNDTTEYNSHGTKCAGEIGAQGNNGLCGVGVAPMVKLGGIRMLDGTDTDRLEADAIGFKCQYVDIYSVSWGPTDDGKTFGGPGPLGKLALKKGAEEGRGGKGNIFVWATGNGGTHGDDCNADGYTSSIYTLSVGSASSYGLSTYYDEKCASTAAVVYTADSHGGFSDKPLVTTGLHHDCTTSFRGTSSAAPLAAGIMALVLQANPDLTWRDVQHLIVHTARKTSDMDQGWKRNAAGIAFNHKFGFGLLDAGAMVDAALKWTNVAAQHVCTIKGSMPSESHITSQGQVVLRLKTDACKGTPNFVKKLEHVQVVLSVEHRRRGDVEIEVTSPHKTNSALLSRRPEDDSKDGFKDWAFMTLHHWGEGAAGEWTVVVRDTKGLLENKGVDREAREAEIIRQSILRAQQRHSKNAWLSRILRDAASKGNVKRANSDVYDETLHGRFKGDYMKDYMEHQRNIAAKLGTGGVLQDESANDQEFSDDGLIAGRVIDWTLVLYGTSE